MSAEVELRILEATERLLRDGASFTHLSLREISQAAGIARSTFYVHFADKSDLLLDTEKETYGFVFHPQFAKNGYFYVTYVQEADKPKGTRVSRFQVKKDKPTEAD